MRNHTDLLNFIAKKIKAECYLEIGVQAGKNFHAIDIKNKRGVDPDPNSAATLKITSNHFWAAYPDASADLIFIDGLHEAEQVRIDIVNAWFMIPPGGVIVVHDSNPHSEKITHVPRGTKEWTGDVYRTVSRIKEEKFTVDFDYGCCVIRKPLNCDPYRTINIDDRIIDWPYFDANRKTLLNLVSVEKAIETIGSWE
jgi:hypothetical protein